MKANQKYFPLLDANGKLTHKFLVVSNIRPTDASAVIGGNERVVRPRLADAKFFFDQDRKKPLESRVAGLAKVVYHNKLGTQGERIERVRAIAKVIGRSSAVTSLLRRRTKPPCGQGGPADRHGGRVSRTARHHGRLLRAPDGLGDDVAHAIEDHYKPRFAGDALPRNRSAFVGAGRQARDAGRPVRHRPAAHRRQGPVRAAPPCPGSVAC